MSNEGEIDAFVSLLWKDVQAHLFVMPAVGDWIVCEGVPKAGNISRLIGILPRKTEVRRLDSFRAHTGEIETIVSNVDRIFVVAAANAEFNERKIARLVAQSLESVADVRIVVNKMDLPTSSETFELLLREQWPNLSIHFTSAVTAVGLDDLGTLLIPGETVAFLGSSGVGKSSLVNALMGEQRMPVNTTSALEDKGTHTTTHREMILMPTGAILVDTPGLKSLALTASQIDLGNQFDDVEDILRGCRYSDCHHNDDEGCALQAAVRDGILSRERFDAYMYLNGLVNPSNNLPKWMLIEKEKQIKKKAKKPSKQRKENRDRDLDCDYESD